MATARRGLEIRRIEVERIENIQGKITSVTGKFLVGPGTGEAMTVVPFPVTFIEEPNISFGSVMAPNTLLVPGSFPTCSATIYQWETLEPDGVNVGRRFYIGATIIVVVTGQASQTLYLHYRAEGMAIRNPVNYVDLTADSTV